VTYLAYKAELTDQEPCPVAVGTQRVATAGEEGITEWVVKWTELRLQCCSLQQRNVTIDGVAQFFL